MSGQTTALHSGSPVFLSQTTVVSRWLVMPTERMLDRSWPSATNFSVAFSMHASTDSSSSMGSCSCHLRGRLVSKRDGPGWDEGGLPRVRILVFEFQLVTDDRFAGPVEDEKAC